MPMPSPRTPVGLALAEMTGGRLVTLEGSGHIPLARDPVKVNLLLREFVEQECRVPAGHFESAAPDGLRLA